VQGTCNGQPFTAQVERGTGKNPLALRVQHNGTQIDAMVLSPRMGASCTADALQGTAGHEPFLLSPMPGLLVDVAVQPGQKVQAGERWP
jgi:propionyl-CoA carboxylase alpha chain